MTSSNPASAPEVVTLVVARSRKRGATCGAQAACPNGSATLIAVQNRDIPPKCKLSLYFQVSGRNRVGIVVRIWGLGGLAAVIWLLSVFGQSRPDALGLDAPATQFSAARADAVLGRVLGDQAPHPSGSAAAQAVRGRILNELAAMGVQARTQTGMS